MLVVGLEVAVGSERLQTAEQGIGIGGEHAQSPSSPATNMTSYGVSDNSALAAALTFLSAARRYW